METSNIMFYVVCVQVIPPSVEIMKLCKSTKAHSLLMDGPWQKYEVLGKLIKNLATS